MPTATTVAQLQVVVDADTAPAEKGLSVFGKSIEGVGGAMSLAFGGAAIAGVAALTEGLRSAVESAAGFEETMSGVKAVSGATSQEMDQLSALALQLGKDTSFSASEAGKGIEELVKGGLTIPDIMNGAAEATLNLAAAGGVSLADAATISANALAEFNLKGSDMAHVADLIAGAANASALDVSDFKFSLTAAGAVASTIGFSFDDLAVAIAEMGKAGITGSDAGTSLKTMMLNLSPSTKSAKTEMQQLGIITADGANQFFDATGKVKSMADVAGILQEATANLTQEQKLNALQTMFGSDAIRAAAVLAKEGASGFDDMAVAMGKVTAADVGATKLDNMNGSIQQLQGSMETLEITIGQALLPALRAIVDAGTAVINAMIPIAQSVLPQIAAEIMNDFAPVVAWFTENWPLISQTYATVASEMQGTNAGLVSDTTTSWGSIKDIVGLQMSAIGDTLKLAMHVINGDWGAAWQDAGRIADTQWKTITTIVGSQLAAIGALIDTATGGMLTALGTWLLAMGRAISDGWQALIDVTTTMWAGAAGIAGSIATAWSTISTDTDTAGRALNNLITGIWQLIYSSAVQPQLDAITGAVDTAWSTIDTKSHAVFDPLLAWWTTTIWTPIATAVSTAVQACSDALATAVDAMSSKAHAVLDPLLSWWKGTIWGPMQAAVETAMGTEQGATASFQDAIDKIKGIADGALQGVRSVWETTWSAIEQAAKSPGAAVDALIGLIEKLKGVMPDWLIPHSPTPLQVGLEGIAEAARKMGRTFSGAAGGGSELISMIQKLGESIGGEDFGKVAAAIAASETGGGKSLLQEGGGGGAGPFQFDPGGELKNYAKYLGVSLAEATQSAIAEPMKAAAWALHGYLGSSIKAGQGEGLSGRELAMYASRYGQRPYGDYWKRAGDWYDTLFGHYADGGVAWTKQLAWVGENGPEAIVPLSRGGGGGGTSQTLTLNVAVGGRIAEQIVVEGYDLAVRSGRLPSRGLRLAGSSS